MAGLVTGTLVVNGNTVTYRALFPRGCSDQPDGAPHRKIIVVGHGHGLDSTTILPGSSFGDHPRRWADAGYVVVCIDNGVEFMDNDAMDRQNAVIDHLVTVCGCNPVVGFSGMSMGGGTALTFLLLFPAKVACVWAFAPGFDLRWLDSQAGYVAPYSTAGVSPADPTWATELTGDYPSGFVTHDPAQNIAAYRGKVPVNVAHATDDATLAYAGSRWFVNAVDDPKVTFRTPDVTGGHSAAFIRNIPTSETLAFFDNQWAT